MLMNDFYRIEDLQTTENTISGTVVFNGEHAIFGGHFPGQPVVPGVCMMKLVKELMEQQTGKQLLLKSAGQVKFLQLVLPDTNPQVEISWKKVADGLQVSAVFKKDGSAIFKMGGTYQLV